MRDHATHHFAVTVDWSAVATPAESPAPGRRSRPGFSRDHTVSAPPAPDLLGSAARVFRGDSERWNPEQLFLAAIAQCHMLSFLFVAQRAGVTVQHYTDTVSGVIAMDSDGVGGEFSTITLSPVVLLAREADLELTADLHDEAHRICFIARSTRARIIISPEARVV